MAAKLFSMICRHGLERSYRGVEIETALSLDKRRDTSLRLPSTRDDSIELKMSERLMPFDIIQTFTDWSSTLKSPLVSRNFSRIRSLFYHKTSFVIIRST